MCPLSEELNLNFSANKDTSNQMLRYQFEKLLPWNWEWNGMGAGLWRKKYFQFPSWFLGNQHLNPHVALAQSQLGLISLWPPPWKLLLHVLGRTGKGYHLGEGLSLVRLNPNFLPVSPGQKVNAGLPIPDPAFPASPPTEQTGFQLPLNLFLDSSIACTSVKRLS